MDRLSEMPNAEAYVGRGAKGGLLSKVERYGWATPDQPGTFEWVPKHLLLGAPEYQRTSFETKVINIAKNWSWVACGVLLVAMRQNGDMHLMDGKHRKAGADKRSDIEALPCMIFEMDDIQMEALGFLAANTLRKPVSSEGKFRALKVAGDSLAIEAAALIEQAGRTVGAGSGPNTFRCLTSLQRCLKEDGAALRRIWPLLIRVCDQRPFHKNIIEGLFYIERRIGEDSLSSRNWSSRVIEVGFDALLEGSMKAAAYYAKGGAKVYAEGILNAINHRLRNRLEIEGS